jgi:hypothetical protein
MERSPGLVVYFIILIFRKILIMQTIFFLLFLMLSTGCFAQSGTASATSQDKRYLLSKLGTADIRSNENCKVVVKITVNEKGELISDPILVRSGTTTSDQHVIDEVIRIVKNEARFTEGTAAVQTFHLVINIAKDENT